MLAREGAKVVICARGKEKLDQTAAQIRKEGGEVKTILTKAGSEFVTPLSVASLSGHHVYQDLFSLTDETEMGHIELSRSADLLIVAPATADLMAKAAHGLANDLASTTLLATDKPVLMAPAMNVRIASPRTVPAGMPPPELERRLIELGFVEGATVEFVVPASRWPKTKEMGEAVVAALKAQG